jgi:hypothetical protein
MSNIQVTEPWSDTLTVAREIDSHELISDATAKTIASWYAPIDTSLYAFSRGESVRATRLGYDILAVRQEFCYAFTNNGSWFYTDKSVCRDVANLDALSAWLKAKLVAHQSDYLTSQGVALVNGSLVRL